MVLYKVLRVLSVNLCIMLLYVSIQNAVSLIYGSWGWLIFIVNFIMFLPFIIHTCLLHSMTEFCSKQLPSFSSEDKCFIWSLAEAFLLFLWLDYHLLCL